MSDEVKKQEELKQQQYLTILKKQYDQEVVNFQLKFLDSIHKEFQRFSTQNQMPVSHFENEDFHIKGHKFRGKISTIEYGAFKCSLMTSPLNSSLAFIEIYGDIWKVVVHERIKREAFLFPNVYMKKAGKPLTIEDEIEQLTSKIKNLKTSMNYFKYYCERENGIEMKYHQKQEDDFFEMVTDIFMKYV
ncbi:hypothetical protein [Vibrio owensii]|uniref:hypothetical protein n=1 Tax=Vibrio owensii TaxID=696485 RepID=UPI0038CF166E